MSQAVTSPSALGRDTAPSGTRTRRRSRALRPLLMVGGIVVVAVASGAFWLNGGRYVSIDNAYVNADKVSLSTDVSGIVTQVAVHEGEQVHKDQVLFRLDDRQFRIALQGAQADLKQTALNLESMKRDYVRMLRDVATRVAQVQADQARYDRYAKLVGHGDLARQDYDDTRYKLAADQSALASAQDQAKVQLAKLGGDPNVDVTTLPAYAQVQARVAEAQRQLDDAVVRAPFDGVVTQVSSLQPGTYLAAGTAAFGLVSTQHVWVDANPKETELTWVKPGDHVAVTVDTYPGRTWDGVVDSISPASGAAFSILPAQNSSGNWVKVVQRIPLRVRVETHPGEPVLRSGMSVEADVDTGHTRKLADLF